PAKPRPRRREEPDIPGGCALREDVNKNACSRRSSQVQAWRAPRNRLGWLLAARWNTCSRLSAGHSIVPAWSGKRIALLSMPRLSHFRNCSLLPRTRTGLHPIPTMGVTALCFSSCRQNQFAHSGIAGNPCRRESTDHRTAELESMTRVLLLLVAVQRLTKSCDTPIRWRNGFLR